GKLLLGETPKTALSAALSAVFFINALDPSKLMWWGTSNPTRVLGYSTRKLRLHDLQPNLQISLWHPS
ncbi:MAG: hypothetical protein AAFQ91_32425, partial [Cyanobacteria bacterium J06621_15]